MQRMVKAVKAGDLDGLQTIIQRARSHRLFDIGKVIDRKGDISTSVTSFPITASIHPSAGNTLLHLACLYEEFDTVRCLLDLKANANARNNLGFFQAECLPLESLEPIPLILLMIIPFFESVQRYVSIFTSRHIFHQVMRLCTWQLDADVSRP
eukprot:853969-Amorphochlora_amoeboformis.AAC.2